ncbi:hypothetical protein HJA82_29225 [Rhizobium bangladeshense]|uniref:cobaltochelatase CobT-related protein n=1 Tax=Rhizobium bangladeshense TaxID=1138189 RepID=UPI001C833ACF|nr:hypothetical protein [Rhizobium bangladeshense]MBX4911397.1 hypothetical protein [Rhizobium bangladeshense]
MNNDIVILREAIKKIVPMLAGKGLTVTQMGTQAYVRPHPVTGLPWIVNIPLLPDNAEPEFVVAIQGFIDHEVSHVLFTDFLYKAREKSKRLHNLHNIIEDTMVERLMGNEFPGSKRNIAKLHEFFVKNITEPALRKAPSKQVEFDYLLVPLTRALAGHQVFQDWMDDNKHWDHELVKEFMARFSQASKDKMPLLATTEETYEIALEIQDILYPPPPPAPPQPPEEEKQEPEDQDQGEDDQDHSDEEQTGDGEGKGEREHTEDNDKASGGEGESDEEEKEDDAGDGESEGSGDGEKEAEDEDDGKSGSESADDGDDDQDGDQAADEQDGSSGEKDDAEHDAGEQPDESDDAGSPEENASDDADDQDGASGAADHDDDGSKEESDGDAADGDEASDPSEADESESEGAPGAGEPDDDADEDMDAEDGESQSDAGGSDSDDDGKEDEASGVDLSNVAVEDAGDDEDGEPESAEESDDATDVAGIGYDPSQNPFAEMTDESLEEKDLSAALVKIIVKEAIAACRAADYSIFTRDYDVIQPLKVPEVDEEPDAKKKFRSKWIVELEEETRSLTGVMQKDIERMMAAQSRVFNVAGQRSGRLNSAGLHRLTAGDARVFSRREEIRGKDTAVSLLSDCSGSMRGEPMATALSASYALASVLERCNIPSECMGFTTAQFYGVEGPLPQERMKQWEKDLEEETKKSHISFSRTIPIYMPIFKEFNERINADVKKRFAYQRKIQPFMGGNIDGESLEYAAMRLAKRKEKRKVIIVLSDGFPAGAKNDDEHLKYMVERLTKAGYDLVGIGIKSAAVARFYDNYLILNSVEELPKAVMGELKKILMK